MQFILYTCVIHIHIQIQRDRCKNVWVAYASTDARMKIAACVVYDANTSREAHRRDRRCRRRRPRRRRRGTYASGEANRRAFLEAVVVPTRTKNITVGRGREGTYSISYILVVGPCPSPTTKVLRTGFYMRVCGRCIANKKMRERERELTY